MLAQWLAEETQKAEIKLIQQAKGAMDVVMTLCTGAASENLTTCKMPIESLTRRLTESEIDDLRKRVLTALTEGGCSAEWNERWLKVSWHRIDDQPARVAGNVHGKCPVCYAGALLVALVPCGHTFCHGCSDTAITKTCPCCRGEVTRCIPVFVESSDNSQEEAGSEPPSKVQRTE
mmetsp:Transcript_27308/g.61652  ORF Transcript_27308/g.61652 Transcript_27308/m.61652 type:complete len:176 (+) Transcript_27308:47-574(+)